MNTPDSPPQMDAARVISGAVTDLVLQTSEFPPIAFDRCRPDEYVRAAEAQYQQEVRPRVANWTERNMTNELEGAMREVVGRYNFILQQHTGQRMVNRDFYPGRPPMDPYEAMDHQVHLEDDVARALMLCDWEEVAESGGPSGSLNAVRATYIRALRGIRDDLVRMFQPLGSEWLTLEAGIWRHIGQTQLLLAPFVYRNAEEFAAGHLVEGRVTDLVAHRAAALPEPSDRGRRLLEASDLECRQLMYSLEQLQFRANRVLDELREHNAGEGARTKFGKMLWPSTFPVQGCKQLAKYLRTDLCVRNANDNARRIQSHWRTLVQMGGLPHDSAVVESYDEIWKGLNDFRTLLNGLAVEIFDGYEGK